MCLGRYELISSLWSPKATGLPGKKTELILSQQGPRVYIKRGEEGWRPALAKTKQKPAMLTSRLSLTLEKRPRAPAQVCSANKTLAALVEPWSPAVGPQPAFVSHFFGRLSEWLSCSLYAACMQWLLSGRRPAWLQRSSINIDFIELETGLPRFGFLGT